MSVVQAGLHKPIDRRAQFPSDLDLSPYVRSCLKRLPKTHGLDILDLPSGFGRHSLFLAAQGNRVVAADIDEYGLSQSLATWRNVKKRRGEMSAVLLDARHPLPFLPASF